MLSGPFKKARLLGFVASVIAVSVALLIAFSAAGGGPSPREGAQTRDLNWRFESRVQPEAPASAQGDNAGGVQDGPDLVLVANGDGGEYVSNEVLLSFDGGIDEARLRSLLAEVGVEVRDVELVSNALDGNDVLVAVSYEGGADPGEVSAMLSERGYVSLAEPNYVSTLCDDTEAASDGALPDTELADAAPSGQRLASIPNDPRYSAQWGLDAIGAPEAWDVAGASIGVTVAVVDSGVDWDQSDLAGNLILGSYAKNTYTGAVGAAAVDDAIGHGTHVAGIVSAVADNSIGVAGVSRNAKVLPVCAVCDTAGHLRSSDVIKAIDYVTSLKAAGSSPQALKNIRVINLSVFDRLNL